MNEGVIVGRIDNGIVIDHIPKGKVWQVVDILKDAIKFARVSLADNCCSNKIAGGKGLIKIENFYPSSKELNLVSLVAPEATITILRGGEIIDKKRVEIPSVLSGVIDCANPNCISSQKSECVVPKIYFKDGMFSCYYCEKKFGKERVSFVG
ncbi:MAG: aspartate carbamoyltransferase regulatory subunit [Candidatus Pacearchaeota archaeon]|nr:aspartate carbamoyltransferase regulatory subunit [Candidatus Pacearchaeota archaeon]